MPVVETEALRPVVASDAGRPGGHIGDPPQAGASGWWDGLINRLAYLTPTARTVLEADSRHIAEAITPRLVIDGTRSIDRARWPTSRIRSGIVVGSVQSGKTANMMAVSAHSLDRGVGVLVILAGTRVSLWLQTYERMLAQLDGSDIESAWKRNQIRVLVPDPNDILGEGGRSDPRRYLRSQRVKIEGAVASDRPVLLVVPKEDSHLLELGRFMRETFTAQLLARRAKPLEIVVLDDEADDGSILDAGEGNKVTPRFIQQLWSAPENPDETWNDELFATYVAYTATPQANFLQASHNPLAPRDFQAALRVPDDSGKVRPRTLTYHEAKGVRYYYTGGRLFYERVASEPGALVKSYSFPKRLPEEQEEAFKDRVHREQWKLLGDALRAYLVAGAIRLHVTGRRLSRITQAPPSPASALAEILPEPHCMLFHPSALTELQFRGADDISRWSAALPGLESEAEPYRDATGVIALDVEGLRRRVAAEEGEWLAWMRDFSDSTTAARMLPGGTFEQVPVREWPVIRELLITEVFPGVRLRVLNSDPRAADRPVFSNQAVEGAVGLFTPPPEIFSIFVAGNVLSRGLTIEGLCTSLFIRSSEEPAADTQMQMQRWFGYRGAYLQYCRLFVYGDQLDLFRRYHFNDEALKTGILARMESSVDPAVDPLVLEGEDFVATAKVDSRRVPLHPGPTPSVRLVEHENPVLVSENIGVLATLLDQLHFEPVEEPPGTLRGVIATQPLQLLDVADLLDRLRYSKHRPDGRDDLYSRWRSIELTLGLSSPLLRLPPGEPKVSRVDPASCPYTIAAYLRLWDALLGMRDARGYYPTDRPGLSWHLLNLRDYQASRPTFYVGVRYGGEEEPAQDDRLRRHGVRPMRRGFSKRWDFLLETLWGTRGRGGGYYGDQLFDYHHHGRLPVPRLHEELIWRPRGHPGLLLFHVIKHPTKGSEMVTVGMALPHGGPDHIAALRGNRERL